MRSLNEVERKWCSILRTWLEFVASEYTDVAAYTVFLVLCDAFCNPCDISDFLHQS